MYMISQFCKYYNYKFDEVMKMKSIIFLDMYSKISIVQAQEDLRLLEIAENHLWLETESKENYSEIYTEKKALLKKVITEIDTSTDEDKKKRQINQINELRRMMGA